MSITEKVLLYRGIISISPWGRKESDMTEQLSLSRASLVSQLEKNPPRMQETLVQFLGWEDPLEKGEATHFSILRPAWWLRW